ncbi:MULTISPECIES: RHS repeat-associated core domain-containing protein [unclassified Streptomyces]|uniref:RHS repeat domain-containing protein n=1 Tax=unclassified Streptomyces TaxID=2593676 RepID=UPI002E0EA123|nr:RHS repeat protein [Streptomyces sp. NBC_01208]
MRVIALLLVAYLLAGLLGGPIAAAAELELHKLQQPDPAPVSTIKGKELNKPDETAKHPFKPDAKATWPTAGNATVQVAKVAGKQPRAKAGSIPVAVRQGKTARAATATPQQAQVQVLDRSAAQAAGIDGVLVAVQGHGTDQGKGALGLTLDYSSFAGVYGGDWASRLVLREVPACALTTPGAKGCAPGKTLHSHNDPKNMTLSADLITQVSAESAAEAGQPVQQASPVSRTRTSTVADGATLLAVTAAPSGANGDFTATSLSPSGKWNAGGSSGAFSWTYEMDTPAAPGGLGPDLGLSYSSQAVDGRTAATNNQANWIGDGWSLSPGSIERRYVSCQDDKSGGNNPSNKVGDQCWKKDNATLSLGGSSSELVKDDASGVWRKKDDDGTRVELLKNSALANGDNDNEYWRVTAPDGTRYYFGYNRPNGWATGKEETNSTWTVPVFGNQSGEPCHATAFKDSWCQQAWRWNLDAVIDPHGNAMTYYWAKESNSYQRAIDAEYKGTLTSYTRGGYLKRIEYGLRDSNFYGQPAAKVDFTVAERCLTTESFDCAADKLTEANAEKWPDVPFDQICKTGDKCEGNSAASYFTRKRLTGVATSVWNAGAYQKVDSWALTQTFPSTGDGTDPPLWLASIARTGHSAGTAIPLPKTTFQGVQLPNRVAGAVDAVPAYNRYRVYKIGTETGGSIGITYSAQDCTKTSLPTASSNTKRCYPVIWSPPDAPIENYEPYQDWFHSYVVTQVLESDDTAGSPVKRTDYSYLGGLAWAKEDDEFTKSKHRTYGDRRGYERVQIRTGDPAEGTQTLSETRYFRGIDGAEVADGEGNEVTDHGAYAGMTREESTYNGSGGALLSATSFTPWRSSATATRSRSADSLPAVYAYQTGTQKDQSRETVTGGGLRRTETVRQFDSYGMVKSESETGDTAKAGDEQCTTTTYNRNLDKNLLSAVAETKTVAKSCGTTPSLPADLINTTRTYYDNATALDTIPTKGDVTRQDENDGAGTGYITISKTAYDSYGRQTEVTDAAGAKTTIGYTPAIGQAPTEMVTTNNLDHTTKVTTDPRRALPTAIIDANGKRSDVEYDALGRTLKGWGPGWTKADHPTQPAAEFTYRISTTEPNAVTSKVLNHQGAYDTSYALYDGMMRPRQTQTAAIGSSSNRLLTETRYDTRGQVWKTYGTYFAAGAPSATLVGGDDSKVPAGSETKYDGAGRATEVVLLKFGDETKRTVTQYAGDRMTVIPPTGGTATTTIVDALGRKTEARDYTNATRTEFLATRYEYDTHGQLGKMTDPAGISWTWTFDARGRQIEANDPDKGTSKTTYDDADRPVKSTDARGVELTTVYDELGRQKELKQGSTVRASWAYDSVAKGLPASSTRYVDGKAYTTNIDSYNDRGQPTSSTTTVPDGAAAGTYTWTFGYNQYNGIQEWVKHPAIGGLPSERQTTVFGQGNLPDTTVAGPVTLVNDTSYDVYGRQIRAEYGTLGQQVYRTQEFDEHTSQLTRSTIDGDKALRVEDTRYGYDPAGNVTRISSTSGQDAAATTDTQCFALDALRRMTEAWTAKNPTDTCATAPSANTVGGPDGYWHSYSYDDAGNRTKEVQHSTGSGADITRTYTTGKAGDARPHALRSVATAGGPDSGKTESFSYDEAGNTAKRSGGTSAQDLTWDPEGQLAKIVQDGKTTEYLYDSAGNRMLAKNADGSTTAYLPGGNELKVTSTGAKTATRYYTHGGETIAVRTSAGFQFLFANQQGTALIAVTMGAAQTVTRRKQLPFGGQRGTTGSSSWPGDRGFVGGTSDPTGYTHLGAREYDPTLGRFLSVDPLLIPDDPTQLNPYVYGNNNPATFADPTGEAYVECASGQYNCTYGKSTGDVKKVSFGKNYEKETRAQGGKVSKNYYAQQTTGRKYTYTKGKGTSTRYTDYEYRQAEKLRQEKELKHKQYLNKREAELEALRNPPEEKGLFESVWDNTGGKVVSTAHDFMQENATLLGVIGVGLGIAAMVASGGLATGFVVAGFALAGATTTDACVSKQWGSCALGVASLGMAGAGVAAGRISKSLWGGAVSPARSYGQQLWSAAQSGAAQGVSRVADGASVMYTGVSTIAGDRVNHLAN